MKDGKIIQIGTPEELVLNPASDYVEEFTRNIPRSKVLSVGALMRDVEQDSFVGVVPEKASIDSVLKQVLSSDRGSVFEVQNQQGKTIGALPREVVIDLLPSSPQGS